MAVVDRSSEEFRFRALRSAGSSSIPACDSRQPRCPERRRHDGHVLSFLFLLRRKLSAAFSHRCCRYEHSATHAQTRTPLPPNSTAAVDASTISTTLSSQDDGTAATRTVALAQLADTRSGSTAARLESRASFQRRLCGSVRMIHAAHGCTRMHGQQPSSIATDRSTTTATTTVAPTLAFFQKKHSRVLPFFNIIIIKIS